MTAIANQSGTPINVTATGTLALRDCQILGFYVNSTSSGTVVFRRGAGGTSSGTVISGTITPAAGAYHPFPADCPGGAHVTVGGTLDATFFVAL